MVSELINIRDQLHLSKHEPALTYLDTFIYICYLAKSSSSDQTLSASSTSGCLDIITCESGSPQKDTLIMVLILLVEDI